MNRRNRAQSSSLFLLELILAILFFSLASAVCVQFFVKSHLLSRNARNLNHAVNECSGIAEIINASDGAEDALDLIQEIYKEADTNTSSVHTLRIYYNDALAPCQPEEASYILQTMLDEEEDLLTARISMEDLQSDDLVYQLTVKHHLQRRIQNE